MNCAIVGSLLDVAVIAFSFAALDVRLRWNPPTSSGIQSNVAAKYRDNITHPEGASD
jgi:hypothetical protein